MIYDKLCVMRNQPNALTIRGEMDRAGTLRVKRETCLHARVQPSWTREVLQRCYIGDDGVTTIARATVSHDHGTWGGAGAACRATWLVSCHVARELRGAQRRRPRRVCVPVLGALGGQEGVGVRGGGGATCIELPWRLMVQSSPSPSSCASQ